MRSRESACRFLRFPLSRGDLHDYRFRIRGRSGCAVSACREPGAGRQVWRHLLELAELDLAGGRVAQALLLLCREDGGAFHTEALLLEGSGAAPEAGDFAGLSAGLAVEQLTLD